MTDELIICRKAAEEAGGVLKSLLGKVRIAQKGVNYNLVTEADIASEEKIIGIIKEHFPSDAVLGEESGKEAALDSERLWIVDPLDGTTNFAHGIPHFAVSVAFARKGEVLCGVVYDPMLSEMFYACSGSGVWCNDKAIVVSDVKELTRSVICTGFYYERGRLMLRTIESMKKLLEAGVQGIRRTGSASLDCCYVACGRFDGYFEYRLSPWDFAAGMLIASEAGGICTDIDGETRGLFSQGIVCGNVKIHKALLSMIV